MFGFLASLFNFGGKAIKGLFDFKSNQSKVVEEAMKTVQSIDSNDAQSTTALAASLQTILSQGSFLEKNWRSWLMVGIMAIMTAYFFFGIVPPHLNDPLSPMLERMFSLLEIGLGGYIARRGIVDVVRIFNIGSVLKALINKKVV